MGRELVYAKIYAPTSKFLGERTTEEWVKIAQAYDLLREVLDVGSQKLKYLVEEQLDLKLRVTLEDGKSFTLYTWLIGLSPDGRRLLLRTNMYGMTNIRGAFGRRAERARDDWDPEIVVSVRIGEEELPCAIAFVENFAGDVEAVLGTLQEDIVGWPSN